MSDAGLRDALGQATIEPPDPVVAGSYGTWRLTYVVGSRGIASGGHLRVHTDSDTDWAIPQFDDPAGPDYMTVQAPDDARVAVLTQGYRGLLLTVIGRALAPGERLVLTYGERSAGGPGSRAQTFAEERRYVAVAVDPDGSGRYLTVPDPPCLQIVGGQATELVVVAPSTVEIGQPFGLLVKAMDAWGNLSPAYCGAIALRAPGVKLPHQSHTFDASDGGVWWLRGCRATEAGLLRVAAHEIDGPLQAESNPIACQEAGQTTRLYWGDPHGGQLVRADKIPAFFRYAREMSGIDFAGYQPNAHRVSNEEWAIQQRAEREAYAPGRFVPLPGYEWSGEPPMGGHHNVYLRRHNQPIRRSCHLEEIADQDDQDTDLPHVLDLHAAYRGADAVITPHVGGGRADLTYHEPTLEPAIEITSTHGSFPWFLEDALRRGYQVGFLGGSDGYTGRPGGEYPGHLERRYAKGSLTALYAEELTIEGVLAALQARHAYATTGARMLIRFDADGHMMGDRYRTRAQPRLSAYVAGTAPIEALELYRGLEQIYAHPIALQRAPHRVRILWEGASRRTSYSGVIWEGQLQVRGGTATVAEPIRFDSPRSHLADVRPDGLSWYSLTCGYRSGIVLDVEGEASFDLVVNTSLLSMPAFGGFGDELPKRIAYAPAERLAASFSLAELADGPKTI
ncbi:MAG: DUF3604 domain-containing protein, partial [Anaerolineae bacterium]|nr:DUF3604 domain-containing protein [Anaerolineae bacterium]